MFITLGAEVVTGDGEHAGTVSRALVDPSTNTLTHVVLAGVGNLDAVAVPIWAIRAVEDSSLLLEPEIAALGEFPHFHRRRKPDHPERECPACAAHEPGDYPALFPEDGSLPDEVLPLHVGVAIVAREQLVGHLEGVEVDDYTAEVVSLQVRLDNPPSHFVSIPTAWARALSSRRIVLDCRPDDLFSLPESA